MEKGREERGGEKGGKKRKEKRMAVPKTIFLSLWGDRRSIGLTSIEKAGKKEKKGK